MSERDESAFTTLDNANVGVAAPTPPAQEDEPVAEVVKFGDGPWGEIFKTYVNLPSGTKLYTRPADDKLRKAAQEIIFQFDLSCRESACFGSVERIENLRAALENKQ